MVLLLFGPPGSGKGTQSRLITNWLKIPGISTGDMLRAEIQAGTELGRTAQSVMAGGGLVGDDLVNKMLVNRVSQPDCTRRIPAGRLSAHDRAGRISRSHAGRNTLPKPIILHLDVPLDALVGRLTRAASALLRNHYNLLHQPPKKRRALRPRRHAADHAQGRSGRRGNGAPENLRRAEPSGAGALSGRENYHQIRGTARLATSSRRSPASWTRWFRGTGAGPTASDARSSGSQSSSKSTERRINKEPRA